MKKRLTALFLCLLMLAVLLPAAAADGEPEETAGAPEESGIVVIGETEEPAEEPQAEQPAAVADAPEEDPEAIVSEPVEDPEAIGLDPDEDLESTTVYLINEKNFPDENFRKWIVANIPGVTVDADGVCSIKKDDANKVLTIIVDGESIGSLTGISKFSNVSHLSCQNNKIKSLDVSGLKQLVYLNCNDNKMEKIKLGSTKKLETLACANNQLTSLSLSYNYALLNLQCYNNKLTSIDLSPCKELLGLNCEHNQLKKLDVSKNEKLGSLICNSNLLTELDVSKNYKLYELRVNFNDIGKLDVTKNAALSVLECKGLKITTLDVSKNGSLYYLCTNFNELKTLDVTKNTDLITLEAEQNQLKTIDLSKNLKLQYLDLCGNQLTAIDLSKNEALKEVALYENQLKTLDFTKNTELVKINCGANELTALDLTKCTKLLVLDCPYNKLQYLYLAYNLLLRELYCYENQLTELDLGMLVNLQKLECNGQTRLAPTGIVYVGGDYRFDMYTILSSFANVEMAVYPFNKVYGYVTLPGYINSFDYYYNTGKGKMQVTLLMPYNGTPTFEFAKYDVEFKGTTPYVLYDGKEKKPHFLLRNENGEIIDPILYTYTYSTNVNPGTAYVNVTFINTSNTATGWFKIYLPATQWTSVENVQTGIQIKWKKVEGAGGYVIYRRAWSSTTGGWTDFKRWYNTTATEWIDTTVYAGSRYQYGIKAYYVNPMDNYNLGVVGPLKTTVRITTRVLKEVNPYTGKLFVKWEGSKYFTGYEVQYARDSAFTQSVKTIKIKKASTYQTTIDNLKSKTTYWVRVRSYHEFEGVTYYGQWSNVMSAKTK